jgi:hypothetical protein
MPKKGKKTTQLAISSHSVASFNQVRAAEIIHKKFILSDVTSAVNTSGAGTISSVITLDPSSSQDWGLISGYYDEFRVVAVRVLVASSQQFSVTALNGIIVVIMDNDSTAAHTYATALQYANKKWLPAIFSHTNGRLWSTVFKRPEDISSPISWVDVATPAGSLGSIQFQSAVAGLTVGLQYFQVGLEYMIEARGRR